MIKKVGKLIQQELVHMCKNKVKSVQLQHSKPDLVLDLVKKSFVVSPALLALNSYRSWHMKLAL